MMLDLAPSLVSRRVVLRPQAAGALSRHTGALTRCTQHGARITGSWRARSSHVVHDNAGAGGRSSIIARASLPLLRPLRHLQAGVRDNIAPFLSTEPFT